MPCVKRYSSTFLLKCGKNAARSEFLGAGGVGNGVPGWWWCGGGGNGGRAVTDGNSWPWNTSLASVREMSSTAGPCDPGEGSRARFGRRTAAGGTVVHRCCLAEGRFLVACSSFIHELGACRRPGRRRILRWRPSMASTSKRRILLPSSAMFVSAGHVAVIPGRPVPSTGLTGSRGE